MISKLCKRYTNALVSNGIISKDDKEIHEYGMTALLINMLNYGIWLLLALLSSTVIETLLFLLSYSTLRNIIGGWHASTPLRCTVCGIMMWCVVMLIHKHTTLSTISFYFLLISSVIFLLIIIIRKEIDSKRKCVSVLCVSSLLILAIILNIQASLYYSSLVLLSLLCNIIMNLVPYGTQ